MDLLLQVTARLSLGFFADGANVARTAAALAAARWLYEESPAVAAAHDERHTADALSSPLVESRDVALPHEALTA